MHEKVTNCPVCRVKLSRLRNLAVEKVLSKCPRPCEFSNDGCNIKLTKEALDAHKLHHFYDKKKYHNED